MQRVMVIGSGGAGKSVFSRRLAELTGLPLIHLDREYWSPGWQPMPEDQWEARIRELVRGDHWIIDGNFGGTIGIRTAAADTVVFLDIPRVVCLASVIRRWAMFSREPRPDMTPGNRDKLDPKFLQWIWNYPRTRRPGIVRQLSELPTTTRVVRLTSRRAMREFLANVPATGPAGAPAGAAT
jgi:adenylate kinase family enzyme